MPLEGLHLGPYRLLRLLGSGGMGEVYLAEDARIDQQVAIKVIRAEGLATPRRDVPKEAARLFEREAKAIARLDHPNILPLYAYGEERLNEQLLTYLVMPYRKEGTLATWLRQRSGSHLLSPAEVVPLLQEAADALQHAHDQQIIHQDVKPTNFLIRLRSDRPRRPDLLLADFGIAKLASATTSTSQNIRGTPIYMAPEQWDGHPVPATDQYALAIMVYELLVGRPPFQGGPGQIMHQHYMTPPLAPSSLNQRLPAAIDEVLLRALAKQPEERFASVSTFAWAFRQAVQRGGEQQTDEEVSRTAARSDPSPILEPTIPPAQESGAAPTVMPANATSLPTEPVTPARRTPPPIELARSTPPPAVRSDREVATKPAQRPLPMRSSGKQRLVRRLLVLVVALVVVSGGLVGLVLAGQHSPTPVGTTASGTSPTPVGTTASGTSPTPMDTTTSGTSPTSAVNTLSGLTEFAACQCTLESITTGPDGNLWFTERYGSNIGRITPSGNISEFPLPDSRSQSGGITRGPDGNLWFTEPNSGRIGRITPSGNISEFPLPTAWRVSFGIAAGPDGNLWFTEPNTLSSNIGRITPSGVVSEFPLPTALSSPSGITAGPDGNLWFTEANNGKIGRITPSGDITEFAIPTPSSNPSGIVAGPDGNLWFTEYSGNQIGRITPSGAITEFPIPTSGGAPLGITAGPKKTLWFTESNGNQIGRITPSGSITEFAIPTPQSSPGGITAGPDGNLWFTEQGNKIGRITISN